LARELSQQFRTRAIEKSYLALVRGAAKSFPVNEGLITASLRFDDGRVRARAADAQAQAEPAGGKPARTAWEVLASSVSSLLRIGIGSLLIADYTRASHLRVDRTSRHCR
jgi:23S rRNA-/tRNA-specific pseudouridylate synthase